MLKYISRNLIFKELIFFKIVKKKEKEKLAVGRIHH